MYIYMDIYYVYYVSTSPHREPPYLALPNRKEKKDKKKDKKYRRAQ